ncbi:hypothetical protein [Aurantiacibacter suaedae]|uniref:hypothetical protein n=1 Tax=Aurantiacibacter suaedae TaxID=2545755 RepID=UPI0013871149|nr:hypothetical protein [Aurantiacibacter suaedae]
MAKSEAKRTPKPRVVFDLKMPNYEYRDSGGYSLSVDRKKHEPKEVASNLLSHLKMT